MRSAAPFPVEPARRHGHSYSPVDGWDDSTERRGTGAFDDSSGLLDDPAGLRARFGRDGYVLLGVVDRDVLLDARRAICGVLHDHGWLDPSRDPMAAVPQVGPFVEGEAKFLEAYDDVQRLEAFHAVPHHPPFGGA